MFETKTLSNLETKREISFFHPPVPKNEKSPTEKLFRTNGFDVFVTFVNFSYYVCIIPFKVSLRNGSLVFHESKIRKILCTTLHTACFIYQLLNLRVSQLFYPKPIKNDPSKLYVLFMLIFSTFVLLTFSITCIRPKGPYSLHSLLESSFDCRIIDTKDRETRIFKNSKCVTTAFCTLALFSAVFSWIQSIGLLDNPRSLAELLNTIYGKVFYTFFLTVDDSADLKITNYKIGVALVAVGLNAFYFIGINLSQSIGFLACLAVYENGKNFREIVQERSDMDLKQITNCYREMKSLTEVVNRVFGTLLIFSLLVTIPYFGLYFPEIVYSDNWITKPQSLFYFVSWFTFLILAAEGHGKVQGVSEYLFEIEGRLKDSGTNSDISLLINEIATAQVGLKGHGYFTITYSFIGNILSVVLTHIIIMLQFQGSKA